MPGCAPQHARRPCAPSVAPAAQAMQRIVFAPADRSRRRRAAAACAPTIATAASDCSATEPRQSAAASPLEQPGHDQHRRRDDRSAPTNWAGRARGSSRPASSRASAARRQASSAARWSPQACAARAAATRISAANRIGPKTPNCEPKNSRKCLGMEQRPPRRGIASRVAIADEAVARSSRRNSAHRSAARAPTAPRSAADAAARRGRPARNSSAEISQ